MTVLHSLGARASPLARTPRATDPRRERRPADAARRPEAAPDVLLRSGPLRPEEAGGSERAVSGRSARQEPEELDAGRRVAGLVLYQFEGCPYCGRVRRALDALGIEIEIRDTLDDAASARELVEATGRRTVPVLRIEEADGTVRWMPESADIVDYLNARFS